MPASWCVKTLFGEDFDVGLWDWGMTEGPNTDHTEMFIRAILRQPKAPMVLLAHVKDSKREQLLAHYAKAGFCVGGIKTDAALEQVPLTTSSNVDSANLTRATKFLKCADEMGDRCLEEKYACTPCEGAGHACPRQASWHPGWRFHHLKGSLLATLLLDALQSAARPRRQVSPSTSRLQVATGPTEAPRGHSAHGPGRA